jgi:hypothetical protein
VPRWWVYPVATAAAFAVLVWRLPLRNPADWVLLAGWLLLVAAGAVLTGIDVHAHRLPTPIIAVTAGAVGVLIAVAATTSADWSIAVRAVIAAASLGGELSSARSARRRATRSGRRPAGRAARPAARPSGTATVVVGALLPYLLAAPVTAGRVLSRRPPRPDRVRAVSHRRCGPGGGNRRRAVTFGGKRNAMPVPLTVSADRDEPLRRQPVLALDERLYAS